MTRPDFDPRGNKDVGDISEPEYGSGLTRILEWIYELVRWLRQREPVTPGDPFTKFATMGRLVQLNVITEGDVLGNDDGDDDVEVVEPEYVVVHAREMYPSATGGATGPTSAEISSAKPNIQYIEFSAVGDTSAEFQLIMPFGWPGNAFQFRAYWSHPTGATTYGVSWKLQAHSATDQEAIGSDFADGGYVDDDGGTTDTLYITPESSPITISGVNAKAGDLIFLRITRNRTGSAHDDMNVEARLHAIRFNLGEAPVEFPPESAVSGVGYAYTTTATDDDLAVPAHSAGDLIVVFARSGAGATIPGAPSGFTSVESEAPAFGNGWRVSWAIDTGGTITTVNCASALYIAIHVYTGASGVGAHAQTSVALGTPGTIPALTLDVTDGTSWVAAFGTLNQDKSPSAPAGMTFRGQVDDSLGGGDMRSWDTAGPVSSWSSQTTDWVGASSAYGSFIAVEILSA